MLGNIINKLKCEFYRIRELNGDVTIINGNLKIANILSELWKKQKNGEL